MPQLPQKSPDSASLSTKERLNLCAVILTTIDQSRARRHDPSLASGIERQIIERELRDLETDILGDPGALEAYIAKLQSEEDADD